MEKRKLWARLACLFTAFLLALGPVQANAGKLPALKVKGTQLVNRKNKPVRLQGVSTHLESPWVLVLIRVLGLHCS